MVALPRTHPGPNVRRRDASELVTVMGAPGAGGTTALRHVAAEHLAAHTGLGRVILVSDDGVRDITPLNAALVHDPRLVTCTTSELKRSLDRVVTASQRAADPALVRLAVLIDDPEAHNAAAVADLIALVAEHFVAGTWSAVHTAHRHLPEQHVWHSTAADFRAEVLLGLATAELYDRRGLEGLLANAAARNAVEAATSSGAQHLLIDDRGAHVLPTPVSWFAGRRDTHAPSLKLSGYLANV